MKANGVEWSAVFESDRGRLEVGLCQPSRSRAWSRLLFIQHLNLAQSPCNDVILHPRPLGHLIRRVPKNLHRTSKTRQGSVGSRFPLGRVVTTRGALYALPPEIMGDALLRHSSGDWGDVCSEDAHDNDLSVSAGMRLLSAYQYEDCPRFWIITEADRSTTTVLIPGEY